MESKIRDILEQIGENPMREGLIDTPKRVAKMYREIFYGYDENRKPTVTTFDNGSDGLVYNEMIIDTGKFYSHCEHHMVPFFGKYWFAYIPSPSGKLIGLSKVARLVDYHSARLQIQERLVNDIVLDIDTALGSSNPPLGMGIVIEATHLCKVMRGVKKEGVMRTTKLIGVLKDDIGARTEFLNSIK